VSKKQEIKILKNQNTILEENIKWLQKALDDQESLNAEMYQKHECEKAEMYQDYKNEKARASRCAAKNVDLRDKHKIMENALKSLKEEVAAQNVEIGELKHKKYKTEMELSDTKAKCASLREELEKLKSDKALLLKMKDQIGSTKLEWHRGGGEISG